jgi:hypothetical protein
MVRTLFFTVSLALLTAAAALADTPAPVYCGSVTCFQFRVAAEGKNPDERANMAMDVVNKYLGGATGRVTAKNAGKNVRLFLNGELLATVTQADANAEKAKSATVLAQRWGHVLSQAFQATKAVK